jgi:hypothetical protein
MSTSEYTIVAQQPDEQIFAKNGCLGAISTYVDEYPVRKWSYEKPMVIFKGRGRKILADG